MGESNRRIRYAVVGAGWIAQEVFMPGVEHTGNSTIAAIVTGSPHKGRKLAQAYRGAGVYSYDHFPELLGSGAIDAVYIATPNELHARFAVPALQAGIHVLLEKPLEVSVERCLPIVAAARSGAAKLMVAYRLHFEPATLAALRHVREGHLGDLRFFTARFAQPLSPRNHRARMGLHSGPVLDMGVYPINAVRNLFDAEPEEVYALGERHPEAGFADFDETVAVSLRFSGGRIAQFVVSYNSAPADDYTLVGTRGSLTISPGFMFGRALRATVTVDGNRWEEVFPNTDHFGGELKYFSSCILDDREPEPNVMEGVADVRVTDAIHRSLQTGAPERLAPFTKTPRIALEQKEELEPVKGPGLVEASHPTMG